MNSDQPNRLVVFDCDGTLVDSQHRIIACMHRTFQAFDLPQPTADAVRSVVGLSLEELIGRLLPPGAAGMSAALAALYRQEFLALRQRSADPEPLFEGAAEAIRRLDAAGFLLGVATGKSRRGLDAVLSSHDLERYFVTLQTADRAPGKPDPTMLRWAIAEAGAEPSTTVMVGDTTFDIEMAVRAGVAAVGVGWGYHPAADLPPAGAVALVTHFDELASVVQRLIGAPV